MVRDQHLKALCALAIAAPRQGHRRLIAIAGPPASGKSTLAARLAEALNARGTRTQVVPMDGFHLDNVVLDRLGLLARKGAPETFDAAGFLSLVPRLAREARVAYPLFDRARDLALAGAGMVEPGCDTLVIEGNYLLFDEPGWRGLAPHWDLSVALHVPEDELRQRLVQRWRDHGLSEADAIARAEGNDMANARRVAAAMLPADMTL